MPSLKDRTVLMIGRGTGIARAIALAVSDRARPKGRPPMGLAWPPGPLDGTRLRLEPGRGVIPHGIDHDLITSEVSPGRQP
jgi:hypothetical protein